jgi:hypothetical protein
METRNEYRFLDNGNKKWIQNVGEESQEVRLEDNIRIYLRVLGCENVR